VHHQRQSTSKRGLGQDVQRRVPFVRVQVRRHPKLCRSQWRGIALDFDGGRVLVEPSQKVFDANLAAKLVDDYAALAAVPVPPLVAAGLEIDGRLVDVSERLLECSMRLAGSGDAPINADLDALSSVWYSVVLGDSTEGAVVSDKNVGGDVVQVSGHSRRLNRVPVGGVVTLKWALANLKSRIRDG
jgi:hypothetical protein